MNSAALGIVRLGAICCETGGASDGIVPMGVKEALALIEREEAAQPAKRGVGGRSVSAAVSVAIRRPEQPAGGGGGGAGNCLQPIADIHFDKHRFKKADISSSHL